MEPIFLTTFILTKFDPKKSQRKGIVNKQNGMALHLLDFFIDFLPFAPNGESITDTTAIQNIF
jgi:hypothetical protein